MSCLLAMIMPTELTTFIAHAPTSDTTGFFSRSMAGAFPLDLVFKLVSSASLRQARPDQVEKKAAVTREDTSRHGFPYPSYKSETCAGTTDDGHRTPRTRSGYAIGYFRRGTCRTRKSGRAFYITRGRTVPAEANREATWDPPTGSLLRSR
ncbi:hypothetical protein BHM03_00049858 [Ensete ventricosum]|nr:hypothetical protein BHM03_00049858 [Ensete ventricosum]